MAIRGKQHFDLIGLLVISELKQRYSGSALGCIWVVMKPLFIFLILNFVFSRVFASNDPLYSRKLLTGIIVWSLFAEASTLSIASLVSHTHIITRVNISRWIFVVSSALSAAINFIINVAVLILFCLFSGAMLGRSGVFAVAASGACALILATSVGFILAPVFVRFRDINQVWEVLLTAGFYFSPIIYPISLIPEAYRRFAVANPMTYVIGYAKGAVAGAEFPEMINLEISIAIIAAIFVLSVFTFRKSARRIAEEL